MMESSQLHPAHRFTSDQKEQFAGVSGVTITSYTMVSFSGRRSEESQKVKLFEAGWPRPQLTTCVGCMFVV